VLDLTSKFADIQMQYAVRNAFMVDNSGVGWLAK
jgi:hypothetical protein